MIKSSVKNKRQNIDRANTCEESKNCTIPLILCISWGLGQRNWGVRTTQAIFSSAAAAGTDVLGWVHVASHYTHTYTGFQRMDRVSHNTAAQVNVKAPPSLLLTQTHANTYNANTVLRTKANNCWDGISGFYFGNSSPKNIIERTQLFNFQSSNNRYDLNMLREWEMCKVLRA